MSNREETYVRLDTIQEKEALRIKIEADTDIYSGYGKEITTVPFGISGIERLELTRAVKANGKLDSRLRYKEKANFNPCLNEQVKK